MLSPPLSACGCHNIVFHLSCLIYFMGFLSPFPSIFMWRSVAVCMCFFFFFRGLVGCLCVLFKLFAIFRVLSKSKNKQS